MHITVTHPKVTGVKVFLHQYIETDSSHGIVLSTVLKHLEFDQVKHITQNTIHSR